MKDEYLAAYDRFWAECPALLYAIALAVGMLAAFTGALILPLIVLLFFLFPLFGKRSRLQRRMLLAFVVSLSAFVYTSSTYLFPAADEEGVDGTAYFVPETIGRSAQRFERGWTYSGRIVAFVTNSDKEVIARNIPATVSFRGGNEERPPADRGYRIRSMLKKSIAGNYFLVTPRKKGDPPLWEVWDHPCNSFCEWRYEAKNKVSERIKSSIADRNSATFLAGIATGSFDDGDMFTEFGRFGLQHIMAISGFHFAIVAAILGGVLKAIVPRRYSIPLLIFAMSCYFMFLGPGPSVVRAWLTVIIALAAYLVNRTSTGLNTLGAAVLLILLYDPLMVHKIGFQFSALMTLAILLFYPLFDAAMPMIIPKKTPGMALRMAFYDQYGYFILAFFRSAFALTLAVNLFAIPLTLYYFHKFPTMSLLYNLFFPFLVSISMLLLMVGMTLDFVFPALGGLIHYSNNLYTYFMLNTVYQMPKSVDVMLRAEAVPAEIVLGVLCLSVGLGIFLRYWLENRRISLREWKYF